MFRSATVHTATLETVDGPRELSFYPLSWGVLTKLHGLLGALGGVINSFFGEDTEARAKAFSQLTERLYADRELMAELVLDSLRDEFPKRPVDKGTVREFLRDVDGPTMVALLDGVWQANRGAFAPLAGRLAGAVRASRNGAAALQTATAGAN